MELKRRERPIILVAALLVVGVGLVAGFAVFSIMRTNVDVALRRNLVSQLDLRVQWAARDLHNAGLRVRVVASRPFLADLLVTTGKPRVAARKAAEQGLRSFLAFRLLGVALYTNAGKVFAAAGHFMAHPAVELPVSGALGTTLLWNNVHGFVLRTALPVYRRHAVVGWAVGDVPLPMLDKVLFEVQPLQRGANVALCGQSGAYMSCFPDTLSPHRTKHDMARTYGGKLLPMGLALAGRTGFIVTHNYLGSQVAAAFRPVDHTGLGMVLTVNTATLYAPVYRQLSLVLPLLIAVLVVALALLRWRLAPLVRALVASERTAREAHAQLKDTEAYIQAILSSVEEGLATISESGIIETFNPAMARLFGYAVEEAIGHNVALLMPEPHRSHHDDYLRHYRETGEARVIGSGRELVGRRKDGTEFAIDLRVSEFTLGGTRRIIGTVRDATGRREAERRLEHVATHDALTDLPSRALIQVRVDQLIRRAERSGQLFAVMFIDLDGFKGVNDSLGHDVGDRLLQQVAQRLRGTLRVEDTVGRLGGDEFVVLAPALVTPMDAALIADKLVRALSEPYPVDGHVLYTTASMGVALYPQDGRDVDTLLKNSDTAMYRAKRSGGRQFHCFGDGLDGATVDHVHIAADLHRALSADELVLYYRPVRQSGDEAVVVMETALKWHNAERGILEAEEFLPIATEAGLALSLAEWTLRQVGRGLSRWRDRDLMRPPVLIRLGAEPFRDARLRESFRAIMVDLGMAPSAVIVAIGEDDFMDDPKTGLEALDEWRRQGLEVALCEYGGGYSSLPYLKSFAPRFVRLDPSFTLDNVADHESVETLVAVTTTLHALGATVTAAQVGTVEQREAMRYAGCDRYAGNLAGPLLRADGCEGSLAKHPPVSR
ncbi:MAG: putative bifunctional diguanylate cyclase/phosphodiesterase [Acidiferrobacter sp.]